MKTSILKGIGCAALLAFGLAGGAVEVETASVLGIKCVTMPTAGTDAAAAVPWLNAANEACKASELMTTGLATGDTIKVFDLAAKAYYMWVYDNGAWAKIANAPEGQPEASAYAVPRGRAFWYVPGTGNPNAVYTQVGKFTSAPVTTTVDGGEDASSVAPKQSLLINPKWADFSIAEKLTAAVGCKAHDTVVCIGTNTRYRFNGSVWEKEIDRQVAELGVTVTQKAYVALGEGEGVIPAGTAFWYVSVGGQPTIAW